MLADLLVSNAAEVLTCAGPAPRIGNAQSDAGRVRDVVIAAHEGRIVFVGSTSDGRREVSLVPGAAIIDASDSAVIPGFVDSHTHVVFAGDRRAELGERLAGSSYAEIAARGGGILSTVRATRAATVETLVAATRPRLAEMLANGTTTAEAKSGYGLTLEGELTMLRAIAALDRAQPIDLVPTFMGAHEVPEEFRGRRRDYVDEVISRMIPAVARERLARWCDVFCEDGVFTPDESAEILDAGRGHGLAPRIHANELGHSGGVAVAARIGARSADHLVFVDDDEADALARAGVVATLLPAAAFYLKLGRFAPARNLITRGVAVALATDVNPGGGLSPSMPFVLTLACFGMGLTFEEALVAATLNAAYGLDVSDDVGSIEIGKRCDLVVVEGPSENLLRVGAETIRYVIKDGRVAGGARNVPESL